MSVRYSMDQIKKMADKLTYTHQHYRQFIEKFLLQMGMRAIAQTKALTPVVTGDLRDRWELSEITRVGDLVYISLINTMEYASYVEDGHMQYARWVPGRWDGDVFKYEPGSKTGMKLSTKWVPGQHMARISMDKIERELPARYQRAFQKFLNEGWKST